jgi:hypothetical protein
MTNYEIWRTGYHNQEGKEPCAKLGNATGNTFEEACAKFFEATTDGRYYYAPEFNTYYGCNLYPTKAQARRDLYDQPTDTHTS